MRVFISYSSRDRWIAKQLDQHLRSIESVDTFLDEKDIRGGDRLTDALREEIIRSDEMVVLLSSASRQSEWVTAEAGAAWAFGKRIVFLLDKLSPPDIPSPFSDLKAFDLNDVPRYLEEVGFRVKGR